MKKLSSVIGIVVVGLTSTAFASLNYTQNFDSIGTLGTAFPAGWSEMYLEGSGSVSTPPTGADMLLALEGATSLVIWNQPEGATSFFVQAANAGATAASANRLLGTSPTSVRGEILQLSLVNDSGGPLSTIHLSYDMQVMALGTHKDGFPIADELPGYSFYFLDGSTWTPFTGLDLSNEALNSVGHAEAEFSFTSPVPNGGTMMFRWFDDNSDNYSPDSVIAIDNVVVTPEPSALSLLALGGLGMLLRRKR